MTLGRDGAGVLESLRGLGEAFYQELAREYYAAHAGFKAEAALQPIYARHAAATSDEALAAVRELFVAGGPDARAARALLEALVEAQVSRAAAPLEERVIAWEAQATVTAADGRVLPYQRVAIEMANAADRTERLAWESARASAVQAGLAPLRQELLQHERDQVERLGLADGYVATFERLSGVALGGLAEQCRAFLRDTQAMWDEVLPRALRDGLGITPGEATRADALALLRAREYDDAFSGEAMEREVRRQVTEMGISPDADGRVIYDVGEREGKRSRAFCNPVRIPDEVYLVLRPHGGQNDWQTLLHELGHALHFAYMDPALPFEARWLGDNSVTEGYAMLFDHRLQDAGWLARYTPLRGERLARYLRQAALEELQFLRRYCAKLLYELELYGGAVSWAALPDRYVEILTGATTFRYDPADAFVDVDPRFYASRYLRAWQLQGVLNDALTDRFDADWWRNPAAGPWMVQELFGWGQQELADEQAQRVAGRGLDFVTIIRGLERSLG
jgi:hypothetical protein